MSPLLGAIIGDIIGSTYEFNLTKNYDFKLFPEGSNFTDDTVLSIAIAYAMIQRKDFGSCLHEYGRKYPNRGYGDRFLSWLHHPFPEPYGSYGNGSAMPTHNHPEGIKGAQAIAMAIFLARTGKSKPEIKTYITYQFQYDLEFTLDQIRDTYTFNETCQGSVPQAIVAFLESHDYESAIRNAVYLGGDSDTLACMSGGIAAVFIKKFHY